MKVKSHKGKQFRDTIDDGIKTLLNFDNDDMTPHLIYCHSDYFNSYYEDVLGKFIMSKMKKYGLQSTILTQLRMRRQNLVTKEKSKQAYQGKLKNEPFWRRYKGSINDDLESFFENLQEILNLEEIKEERIQSFFLPKLTDEEWELIEKKDREQMKTYEFGLYADVKPKEMKKSNSKDKYLHGTCFRVTKVLNLDDNLSETSSESSSEYSSTITNESESLIEAPARKKRKHDL